MTNDNFWECACLDDYIHDKRKRLICPECESVERECPDADEADMLVHFSLQRAELEDFLKTPGIQGDAFTQDAEEDLAYVKSVLEGINVNKL